MPHARSCTEDRPCWVPTRAPQSWRRVRARMATSIAGPCRGRPNIPCGHHHLAHLARRQVYRLDKGAKAPGRASDELQASRVALQRGLRPWSHCTRPERARRQGRADQCLTMCSSPVRAHDCPPNLLFGAPVNATSSHLEAYGLVATHCDRRPIMHNSSHQACAVHPPSGRELE